MVAERIEETILRNLLCNEEYYRKVTPHLSVDYFESPVDRTIYEEIHEFSTKYDKLPTQEVLRINLGQRNDLSEEIYKDAISRIAGFSHCLLYTSPSPRDQRGSRMPSSA